MKRIEYININSERRLAEKLRAFGSNVYHPSWPDLLVIGQDKSITFIEVKSSYDNLSVKQKETVRLLKELGFRVEILQPNGDPFIEKEKREKRPNFIRKIVPKNYRKYLIKHPRRNKDGISFKLAELIKTMDSMYGPT